MSKRRIDDATNGTENSEAPGTKRRKVRSCLTCRKQKARCEFTTSVDVCHRCNVLNIPCAFEPDAHANLLSSTGSTAKAAISRSEMPGSCSAATTSEESRKNNDQSVENRLEAIENVLKQVLRATGLPSLESFSSTPGFSQQVHMPPSHIGDYSLENDLIPRRDGLLYQTPIDLGYITLAESVELTSTFEMRYNHCVYTPIIKSHRMTLERPFTFTVMCALALRLKTTVPKQAKHQISRLLESQLREAMVTRPHTTDTIHALLLLSLWSSVLVSDTPDKTYTTIPDGWLLLSMAVRMAQSLRLDKASDEVYSRIHRNEEQSSEYEIALEKARVWYTLVTYDLSMSVGHARPRLVSSPDSSHSRILINSFARSPVDQCLAFHLDALLLVHKVYEVPRPSLASQVPQFSLEIDNILHELEELSKLARESAMNGKGEELCTEFRMFYIYEQYCECVCLSKACEILISPPFDPPVCSEDEDEETEATNEHHAFGALAFLWLNRLCSSAENVLNEAFPPKSHEAMFLSTAPDHMLTIIAFCAAVLIGSQRTVLKYCRDGLDQADGWDDLVARTSKSLAGLILPDSLLPQRYARSLSAMLEKWKIEKQEALPRNTTNGSVADKLTASNGDGGSFASWMASVQAEQGPARTKEYTDGMLPSIFVISNFLDPSTWL